MQRILILGAGFAGLWAAVAAARKLAQASAPDKAAEIEILVVNERPFHSIRVRNYEADLEVTKVALADIFEPIGVRWLVGRISHIDTAARQVGVVTADGERTLEYARLVMALGSRLLAAPIAGLDEFGFNIDSIEAAEALRDHLQALASRPPQAGRFTAVVIGAGLTGCEIAAELPQRIAAVAPAAAEVRVILIDRNRRVAQAMGEAQPVIEEALQSLGVELLPDARVTAVTANAIELDNAESIAASTVIWCGGMQANALNQQLGLPLDAQQRLPVDNYLRVQGAAGVYAAGDCANYLVDGENDAVMSCQYSRPMGRYVGHNVAADLLGEPLLPLTIDWYTTIVDLGPWGAVYTDTRARRLVTRGAPAKQTKQLINGKRIYPPLNRDREAILAAAAPAVQTPPPDAISA